MKAVKQQVWALRKELIRRAQILKGTPMPTGMVGLSPGGVQEAYGTREDVTIHSFFRKSSRVLIPPGCLEEDQVLPQKGAAFPTELPECEMVVLEARNSNFTFQHHHLLDDERRVIYEPQLRFKQLPVKDKFLVNCRKLNGTVAYLGNTLFCQYGHWLQRQLPLLHAYWDLFGKENIDYYYIGDGGIKDFALESLRKLGIRAEQIISVPCRGDRALIGSRTSDTDLRPAAQPSFHMDEPSHRFLQENLFTPGEPVAGSRLFVMRGEVSGRREHNLPEVKEAMEPLGFEFVTTQGMTMQQEADLFGNAEVIVAVHGAALHNLLFARPGTTVIEIFPYDYFEESNYVIANHGGCNYFYLIGDRLAGKPCGDSLLERNRADVMMDVEKLIRLCNEAGVL